MGNWRTGFGGFVHENSTTPDLVVSSSPLRRVSTRRRAGALLLALSLGAAACGSDGSSTATGGDSSGGDSSTAESASPDESSSDADSDGADSAGDADETADQTADDSTDDGSADEAADGDTAAVNLFPDVDVLNIADGATINLSDELAGGDRPVLLWFWAPH